MSILFDLKSERKLNRIDKDSTVFTNCKSFFQSFLLKHVIPKSNPRETIEEIISRFSNFLLVSVNFLPKTLKKWQIAEKNQEIQKDF